jgi:hypothetical protein
MQSLILSLLLTNCVTSLHLSYREKVNTYEENFDNDYYDHEDPDQSSEAKEIKNPANIKNQDNHKT